MSFAFNASYVNISISSNSMLHRRVPPPPTFFFFFLDLTLPSAFSVFVSEVCLSSTISLKHASSRGIKLNRGWSSIKCNTHSFQKYFIKLDGQIRGCGGRTPFYRSNICINSWNAGNGNLKWTSSYTFLAYSKITHCPTRSWVCNNCMFYEGANCSSWGCAYCLV